MAKPRTGSNSEESAVPAALRAGDLLRQVVRTHGLHPQGNLDRLSEAWKTLVGAETASQSRVVSFQRGLLTVEVATSALGQELSVYLKRDLLSQLQAETGLKVVDLRCRIGGWSEG